MKLATYNVNGVNGRLTGLLRWLDEFKPDIACLQELKTSDEKFPAAAIEQAGYGAIWHGQKSYNGVAILARGSQPVERRRGLPNPAGEGKVAMVDAGDIAAVAAAALMDGDSRHVGQCYDLTGPVLFDLPEAAAVIARAAGRPVAIRPMTSPQFLAMLAGVGVPSDYAAMLLRDQEAIRDGAAAIVTPTVARIIGRQPVDLATYATHAAPAWRQ